MDLSARTGVGYSVFVGRRSSKDPLKPVALMDERSRDFFEVYFNIPLDDLLIKYENYHVLGIKSLAKNHTERVNLTRGLVRMHINRGLRKSNQKKK